MAGFDCFTRESGRLSGVAGKGNFDPTQTFEMRRMYSVLTQ
jgi:hypothetical protein